MFMLMKLSGSSDDQIDGQMGSGFLAFTRKLRILVCRTQSLYAATLHVHDNIYIRYKLCRDGRWLFFFFRLLLIGRYCCCVDMTRKL